VLWKYPWKIKKENSPKCVGAEDDAHHTFFMCPNWSRERVVVTYTPGTFQQRNMVELMMRSPDNWKVVSRFSSKVQTIKEEDERTRRGECPRHR
jgi:hypothetical protein